MKKFLRTCGIIALFLFGFGAALVIAGCAMGGADKVSSVVKDVTDGNVNIDIGLNGDLSGVKVGGVSAQDMIDSVQEVLDVKLYNLDDFSSIFDNGEEIYSGTVEKFCISSNGVEDLELNIGGCAFKLLESENGDFWVEAENVDELQAFVDGDTLHVNVKKTGNIKLDELKTIVKLYVPSDMVFDKAKIDLGAGSIDMGSFAADKVELAVGAGSVDTKTLDCDELKVSVGAGKVDLKSVMVKKLEAKVSAGSFVFEGKVNGDAKMSCAAGSIDVKLKNEEEDFDYDLSCSAGGIKVGNDLSVSGVGGSKKVDNDADQEMELSCSAGSIKVIFE
ncbi:MAG: DUF4097 family beta strand repeat protein [Lachnospiraceae bacterium]|nr:DUF4097 family beta strand repeat protein [Lachnospiraceae bacterium]